MKKHLLLAGAALLAAASATADTLTPEQALNRALGDGPAAARAMSNQQPQLLFTKFTADMQPAAYIFARPSQAGYMVLGADDVAVPVLGYSDDGVFDPDNTNLQFWLGEYANEIARAKANGAKPASKNAQYAPANWAKIAPLCKTTWDQGKPYNDLCPLQGSARTVTGCVATAMAQVMKYFNYPATGYGNVLYSTNTQKIQVSCNFADYTFDWDQMLNTYSNGSNSEQNLAVAQLMFCCGASVKMDYTTAASGAQSADAALAMINNFKYNKALEFMNREMYSLTTWQTKIYENIKNVGPVFYAGVSAGGGHAFVCDGYDTNGYFHFNWGWSGASDGYYLLTALNPEAQGIGGSSTSDGFNTMQRIILGIQPEKANSSYSYSMVWFDNFEVKTSQINLGKSFEVSGAYSYSVPNISGSLGLFVTNSSGTKQYVEGSTFNGVGIQSGFTKYQIALPTSLATGTYTVTPAWKLNGESEARPILVGINKVKSYKMTIDGNKATFEAIPVDAKINITDVVLESPKAYAGKTLQFTAKANNNSSDEFYNTIQGALFETNATNGSEPVCTGNEMLIDVEPGTSDVIEYASEFAISEGTYKFCFINPQTKEWISSTKEVTLVKAPTSYKLTVKDFELHEGAKVVTDVSNLLFNFNIECTQGFFDDPLMICIIKGENKASTGTWAANQQTSPIILYEGDSKEVAAFCSISMPRGNNIYYTAYVVDGKSNYNHTVLSEPYVFLYDKEAGVADVEADQQPVSVELYNLQGISVDAATAAPGLYIKVAKYANGSSKATKISIK